MDNNLSLIFCIYEDDTTYIMLKQKKLKQSSSNAK